MYTTEAGYTAYTGETAPSDYTRQELLATTLFKSIYPNFPSESQYNDLEDENKECIEYAIYEQIKENVDYTGTAGNADSFTVGNFSITDGTTDAESRVSFMAMTYLKSCGATYKGVGTC